MYTSLQKQLLLHEQRRIVASATLSCESFLTVVLKCADRSDTTDALKTIFLYNLREKNVNTVMCASLWPQ